jgi:hypothetical protein
MKHIDKLLAGKQFRGLIALAVCIVLFGSCGTTITIKEGTEIIADNQYAHRYNRRRQNYFTAVSIPATVVSIGASAFENNALAALDIPPLANRISDGAFRSNSIETLFIPSTVKHIGASAFSSNKLSELIISEGVEIIEDYAFVFNPSLQTVAIPESVVRLSPYAFDPGVILTGKEQFRRAPDTSYCRIVTNFNHVYRYKKNPNSMKVNGQPATSEAVYFMTDAAKDSVITFDIHNTRAERTDLAIAYRFLPGHDYELVFEEYDLTFVGARGEMLEFIVIDQESGRGKYWQYAWRDGETEAIEAAINYQRLMEVYRPGNGFESGHCKKDEQGNYATLGNETFRGKVPRFLYASPRIGSKPKQQ